MNTLRLVILLIIHNVVISEETANKTETLLPEPKNAFRFEDQSDERQSYGLVRFEDQGNRFQQLDDSQNAIDNEGQRVKFEENKIENLKPNHQKKKKRRRRPRQRIPNGSQNGGPGYPVRLPYPGAPSYPGSPVYPGPPGFGPGPIYPGQPYPSYAVPHYKPRPSATSAALSAVTEALTSVALYDDAQCVPRLLCEAAGGGAIPGSGVLQSVAGLQPLLTLLAAYNGISSSPLFVFGRAVFLGMTSKANPGTCRYAYPQCPNDPEQLVHYLNNHNGGFFRFFAAPQLNQQQGLEQFYNQLSGQNYGLYQPQQNANQDYGLYQPQQNANQNYGLYQPQQSANQNYGLYQPQQNTNQLQHQNFQQAYGPQQNYQNQQLYGQLGQYQNQILPQSSSHNQNLQQFGYGLSQQQYLNQNHNQKPSPYENGYGFYGQNYPYQKNLNQSNFKNNDIQKRIQNIQNTKFVDNARNPKWSFPEDSSTNNGDINNVRLGKVLKFPKIDINSNYAPHGFVFPGIQSNRKYPIDSIEADDNDFEYKVADDFKFPNYRAHGTVDGVFNGDSGDHEGARTLYIVRGNGDPNNPEIVHLRPGQTL